MKIFYTVLWLMMIPLLAGAALGGAKEDFQVLVKAGAFHTSRIGEKGAASPLAEAYVRLAEGGDAAVFVKLLESAETAEGRCYALLGLHETDRKAYRAHRDRVAKGERVRCMWFGVKQEFPGAEMRRMMESGEVSRAVRWGRD